MESPGIFGLRFLVLLLVAAFLNAALTPTAEGAIRLDPVLQGLSSPLYVTNAHDDSNRLFIVEQGGRIKVLAPGATTPTVFLDITSRVLSGGERGLLGLAFHPQFGIGTNSRFFVNYTRQTDGATVIAEYRVSADPNVADTSEIVHLVIAQPFANHNGGMIEFGFDGFLYIGMGDGGDANDPGNRAQNIDELLGKILRIDVDHPASPQQPYSSPPGNPFFGATAGRDEIFAVGMRNPFRFSFDRQTGQLYVGDVGQGALEEVDIVTVGGNYGWRVYEGTSCTGLDPGLCTPTNFVPPIVQYGHSGGRCSITGGYVYRGSAAALPAGTYVFGDYCSGEIFSLVSGAPNLLLDTTLNISSFGEDEAGEIYVVGLGGTVHRIASTATTTTLTSSGSPALAGSSVTFTATVTGNNPTGSVTFTEDVGGNAVCAAGMLSGSPPTASCSTSSLAIGTHSIVANYAGDVGNAPSSSTPLSQVITGAGFTNLGFETPNLAGGYQYAPTGATWVFTGDAGITGNANGFTSGNPPAPEGVQVAFLERTGQATQTANIAAGTYTLSIRAAQRGNYQLGIQVVRLQVDGVTVGQYQPPDTAYTNYTTAAFTIASSGNHTLTLAGVGAGADDTAFVDDVRLTSTVVTPVDQTISFGALADRTLAASPFTVSATASSGLVVSFSSLTTPVCTVSGTTVTLVATGTCTIRAAQAGNANYNPAPNVDRSFNVTPATVGALTNLGFETPNLAGGYQYAPTGATWVFTGDAGITANANGFTSGNPPAPEGVQVAFLERTGQATQTANIAAGTYTLSIRAAQRGNYQLGIQVVRLQVDGVTVGQYQPPDTAYTNYTTAAFTIASSGSHTVSLAGIGTGSDFTAFVDDVRLTSLTTTPTSTTLTSAPNPAPYGTSVTFTATVNGSNLAGSVNFTEGGTSLGGCATQALTGGVATCATSSLTGGSHNIVATYSGDGNNAGSSSTALSQTITPADQTISFGALADRSLSASPFIVSATASSGLAVSFSSLTTPVCTVSGTTVTLVATGSCTIRAAQAGNANYNPAPNVDRSFNVTPATVGALTNLGFETPNLAGGYQYAPSGATWVFTGDAGITGNANGFTSGNPPAPEGVQVAFLERTGQATQTANIAAGTYTLSIRAAQRGNYQFGTQIVRLQVDGVTVGQYQPPDTAYTNYTTAAFTIASSGSHTVSLAGIGTGSDFTAFVDDVRLAPTVVVTYELSGTVSAGSALSGVTFAAPGGGNCTASDAQGHYSCTVPQGWSGSVTPSLSGYAFTPAARSYSSVAANQTAQDYAGTSVAATMTTLMSAPNPASMGSSVTFTATVAGNNPTGSVGFTENGIALTGCSGIALTGSGNSKTAICTLSTLAAGSHNIVATYDGDGGNAGSSSTPLAQTINASGLTLTLSGTVYADNGQPLAGVRFDASAGQFSCPNSDSTGHYFCTVPDGWSGTVTPSLTGYEFTPSQRAYDNVTADETQDYLASPIEASPPP